MDITALALKFELSGGYIRNAVQAALSRCVFYDRIFTDLNAIAPAAVLEYHYQVSWINA